MNKASWMNPLREEAGDGDGSAGQSGDADSRKSGGGEGVVSTQDFATLRAQVENTNKVLESLVSSARQKPAAAAASPAPGQQITREQLEEQFWKNPLPIVQAISQRAAAEAASANSSGHMETLIEVARDKSRKGVEPLFDKYNAEIESIVNSAPIQYRANSSLWTNARNAVFGKHMDEIRKDTAVNAAKSAGGSGGPESGTGHSASAGGAKVKLSEDELSIAKKLNITPEEYQHGKEFVNDQQKHWSRVITLDNRRGKRREVDVERSRRAAGSNSNRAG